MFVVDKKGREIVTETREGDSAKMTYDLPRENQNRFRGSG